jgi:hypothetical protein
MALRGRRYGEPAWGDPAFHGDEDPALKQVGSYEEERLAKGYPLPVTPRDRIVSIWGERPPMSILKSVVVPRDIPA